MISFFDIFKVGLGPSSSHTTGPMKAACRFATSLCTHSHLRKQTARIAVEVYGSLALTGKGHRTFDAILLGLEGADPATIDPTGIENKLNRIHREGTIILPDNQPFDFEPDRDLQVCLHTFLPRHPNALRFNAYDAQENIIQSETYYSIGGGFISTEHEMNQPNSTHTIEVPYPFQNALHMQQFCMRDNISIAQLVLRNEAALLQCDEANVLARISQISDAMFASVHRGLHTEGILPGGLNVHRRAPTLMRQMLKLRSDERVNTQLWPMIFAMAVNEENAAGGRIVTAPTNGAAGVIPAVLAYYRYFNPLANNQRVLEFLLTAAGIGMLYKMNASISGADVGCQGEVGTACSMAAGAYSAIIGGTVQQVHNAAEMAMEHLLGLTCDPVAGLVQIPCIERNGIAAESAIKFGTLSLLEDGENKKVSLDEVIATMLQTGHDMSHTYKETSLAGLASTLKRKPISVTVVAC